MIMKLCGEIMIPLEQFPQLPYWFSLRQAMAELDRLAEGEGAPFCSCRVVLVFTAQNQLLGILRQQDILRGLQPEILAEKVSNHQERLFEVKVDPNLYRLCEDNRTWSRLQKQIERPISDFARPIDAMVNHDDNLLQAIDLMIDKDLDLLPVLQEDRIAGVVTMLDVLRETTKLLIGPVSAV